MTLKKAQVPAVINMKPTQKSLKPHVNTWVEDNLITQEQGDGILAKYPTSSTSPVIVTFSIVGGMLCLLGVILLVSANWQSIPREVKLGALLGLLTASTLLGTEGSRRKWHPAIPEIGYLFAAVLPLVGLALVSQIFNLSGSGFALILTWFISILFLPFLSFSPSTFVVWLISLSGLVPLAITEYHRTWFTDEYQTISVVYALLGAVIAAASQLWSKAGRTMQRAWGESLGLIMTSLGLYTCDLTTYYPHSHVPIWAIAWGAVFILNLGAIFIGYKAHRAPLVTLGFVMLGIIILSFYCRLVGSMLSTGTLFLSAGTLLIILIFTLHRLRKSILQ
jgi:uncharacterized membrane protein